MVRFLDGDGDSDGDNDFTSLCRGFLIAMACFCL
jgi:hypothetical protein